MGVVNGEVNYLQVDFIMGLQNGTQMQVYAIPCCAPYLFSSSDRRNWHHGVGSRVDRGQHKVIG
jgi:hypothetical protein